MDTDRCRRHSMDQEKSDPRRDAKGRQNGFYFWRPFASLRGLFSYLCPSVFICDNKFFRLSLCLCASAVYFALMTGCASVKPWKRGTLADPIMQPDRDPIGSAQIEHVYFSREEASGGRTVGG